MILCSPTEPKSIVKELGGHTSGKPERYGVDFLWRENKKWFGVQRKRFPDDFEASLQDGRLAKELGQLVDLDQAFLILEGFGQWTTIGEPMGRYSKLTKAGMFGALTSIAVSHGVPTYRVRDQAEFCDLVLALKAWTSDPKHLEGRSSLTRRPKGGKSKWGTKSSRAWQLHFLQGFDGIGPVQAEAILQHFGGMPIRWDLEGPEVFEEIPGVGKKTAESLWNALK